MVLRGVAEANKSYPLKIEIYYCNKKSIGSGSFTLHSCKMALLSFFFTGCYNSHRQ